MVSPSILYAPTLERIKSKKNSLFLLTLGKDTDISGALFVKKTIILKYDEAYGTIV